jgi:hypothetical protein
MPIPGFRADGLLPPGEYFAEYMGTQVFQGHDVAGLDEIEDCFVSRFPQSVTRPVLFNELRNRVQEARDHLTCFQVLVSGEFVTSRVDPEDIFVALDVLALDWDELSSRRQWLLDRLFNSQEFQFTSQDLKIYTEIVRAYPPTHAYFEVGYNERLHARFLAGSPVSDVDHAGYAEFMMCEGRWDDVASIFSATSAGEESA